MAIQAMNDLECFAEERGVPLPLPVGDIAQAEARGLIVDLETGKAFLQVASWEDFAERWVMEMLGRHEQATAERLSRAIFRASGGMWSTTFCNAVSCKVLTPALNKSCAVQTA